MENFVLYDEIGQGENRIVYKGRKKGSLEYLAIHCVDKLKREELQNSVRINHSLEHKNIVQFHEWYETSNHLWLVVELCSGLSLEAILKQDGHLPERTIKRFGRDIVEGLFYLHTHDIVYCDLVPSKVILDVSGILKLSNFTLARYENELDDLDEHQDDFDLEEDMIAGSVSKRIVQGSPLYIPPEILKGGLHNKCSDFWSLGCLLYECFTGNPPYRATNFQELMTKIISEDITHPVQTEENKKAEASNDFYSLIASLLAKDPHQRIGWRELCMHSFWEGALDHILKSRDEIQLLEEIRFEIERSPALLKRQSYDEETSLISSSALDVCEFSLKKNNLKDNTGFSTLAESHAIAHDLENISNLEKCPAVTDLRKRGSIVPDSTGTPSSNQECQYLHVRESKRRLELVSSLNDDIVFSPNDEKKDIGLNLNLIDLLYHPSDLEVSPIIDNPRIQKQPIFKWDQQNLPFSQVDSKRLQTLSKGEADNHVKEIVGFFQNLSTSSKNYNNSTVTRQKMHSIAYLCTIAKHEQFTNKLFEKDFVKLLIKELKVSGSQDLKLRSGRLLGVMACSATYIPPSFNMTEVFTTITETIRDNLCIVPLKAALLPALGEFMFYAATQEEGEDKKIINWDPPGAAFTIVARCLQPGEDILVQHFSAKIVENIMTTAGRYCRKFLVKEIGCNLWNLFTHSVSDAEKITASSALCRLSMHSNTLSQQLIERIGSEAIFKALFTGSSRIQQSLLTILITWLSSQTFFKKIIQESNVLHKIVRILETQSPILRGKVYLFIAEIALKSCDGLLECLNAKLVAFIERDSKKVNSQISNTQDGSNDESNVKANVMDFNYTKQCLELVIKNILKQVPLTMSDVLKVLDAVVGRHHPSSTHTKQLRTNLPRLSIVLHAVTSQVFRSQLVNDSFIESIGLLLSFIQSSDEGKTNLSASLGGVKSQDIMQTAFSIVEAIAQHPMILLQLRDSVIEMLLPPLGMFCGSSSGDSRMFAVKLFSDIVSLYFENDDCNKSSRLPTSEKNGRLLQQIINDSFIQRIDAILEDQDPIPSYGLKLLQTYAARDKQSLSALIEDGIMLKIFALFETHQNDATSSTLLAIINLISTIVATYSEDLSLLCEQGLVDYLMSAFIAASSVLEDDETGENAALLFLPLLETLLQLLKCLEVSVKSIMRSKDNAVKQQAARSKDLYNVEMYLQRCKALSELNGVLITLLCFDDIEIQNSACHCLYISAELFGGEYEESFSEDNLECLTDAIQMSNDKRKKLLLRVVKRFVTSSKSLLRILQDNGSELNRALLNLVSTDPITSEQKSVKLAAEELLSLINRT